jgi:histidine kinase-like protein
MGAIPPARPVVRFKLKAVPKFSKVARELTSATLDGWGLGYLAESANSIVAELFANAANVTPRENVLLLIEQEGSSVVIGIWDPSPKMPVSKEHDVGDESGRGLRIVEELADENGVRPAGHSQGKIVWARLNV